MLRYALVFAALAPTAAAQDVGAPRLTPPWSFRVDGGAVRLPGLESVARVPLPDTPPCAVELSHDNHHLAVATPRVVHVYRLHLH